MCGGLSGSMADGYVLRCVGQVVGCCSVVSRLESI